MKILYSLIRALKIDARKIFNPEMEWGSPSISRLRLTIEACGEKEVETLIPIVDAVLDALRNKQAIDIKDIQENAT